MTWLKTIYDRRDEIAACIIALAIAWTPIASLIAAKVKRPDPLAAWWKRAIFDMFVDVPAWIAAAGRSGVLGGRFNFPGMPSRQAGDNPARVDPPTPLKPDNAGPIDLGNGPIIGGVILGFALAAACCAGCATFEPGAQQAKGAASEILKTARDAWMEFDRQHQKELATEAINQSASFAALDEWRKGTQADVRKGFLVAWGTLVALDAAIVAYLLGGPAKNLTAAIAKLWSAAIYIKDLLVKIGVDIPTFTIPQAGASL